ncbi:MAG TPA: phosphoheptose isomerase [Flavobacteriales bacterium]|jgi:D-sedoheptulose 7-phosphate isomerase|nr:phosphoheptose isomerase [Flavobacteriales bacterium]
MELVKASFQEASEVLDKFATEENFHKIQAAASLLSQSLARDGRIISCGNGGSMSDAMHFAEELSGKFREERKAYSAMAISDAGHLSCVANDYGYAEVFSRYVEAHGRPGDSLLVISTSGNSENVLKAAQKAHEIGMNVIGLTGKTGGPLAELCDIEIRVEHMGFSDRIQEIHIKVIHCLIETIEHNLRSSSE